MHVNFKTKASFQRDNTANKSQNYQRRYYGEDKAQSKAQVISTTEIPDEVTKLTKEKEEPATIEAAKKLMQGSNDPLLKFIGDNGELIVNVIKEFANGFKTASAAIQQPAPQQLTQQTPTPPPFYGTLKALQFRDDQVWQNQARSWEYYIASSPHGKVNVNTPQPTQYSVQPGSPSIVEQSGAKSLKELEHLSRVLDGQTPINPAPQAQAPASQLTPAEMADLEDFRKNGGDPLADKIKKKAPPQQEEEVNLTMSQDAALIGEKLKLLTGLLNSLDDDKIREYGRDPDRAIEELDKVIQKPIVAMILGPYKPVIKEVGINEFKAAFEQDCAAKLSLLNEDEKLGFLVKLDAWRQKL